MALFWVAPFSLNQSRHQLKSIVYPDIIIPTLQSNSVLLPVDSAPRLLELLVLLDKHWRSSRLRVPICLISRTGREMLTHVRSMVEWLGGSILKEEADLGEDRDSSGHRKRKRDEEQDGMGALALRFRCVLTPFSLVDNSYLCRSQSPRIFPKSFGSTLNLSIRKTQAYSGCSGVSVSRIVSCSRRGFCSSAREPDLVNISK